MRTAGVRRLVALSTVLVVYSVAAAPAASRGAAGIETPGSISDASERRFVDLWSRRVLDRDWFGPYLQADEVPADVLAEGYHSLDARTKVHLVSRLFDRLAETVPELKADLRRAAASTIDQERRLLYLFIFDKAWVKALRAKAAPQGERPVAARPSSRLSGAVARLKKPAPVAMPRALSALAPFRARPIGSLLLGPAGTVDEDCGTDDPPVVPPVFVPGLDGLTYRVCAESASRPLTCSTEAPLGTPLAVDVTGDTVPDVAGQLSPGLNTSALAGLSMSFTARRLSASGPLPAHVFALWEAPIPRRIAIGVDGRASTLAPSSTATFTVRGVQALLAGILGADLALENTAIATVPFPTSLALTFGMWTLASGVESDPMRASLQFAPVPQSWNASVAFCAGSLPDGSKRTQVVWEASGPSGPLTADLQQGTDIANVYVSNVPTALNAAVTVGSSASRAAITSSQSINLIQGSFRSPSSGVNQASAELRQTPTSLDLFFGRQSVVSGSDSFTVPQMTYTANADTLDVTAFVDASLFAGDQRARAQMFATNLGRSSSASTTGTTLRLRSTPATPEIEIHTWGQTRTNRIFDFCVPSACPTFRLRMFGHAGVNPLTVNDLGIRVTALSDLRVILGLATGIDGSYGTIRFAWSSIDVTVDIEVRVDACVSGFCVTIVGASLHGTFPVNILFHLGTPHQVLWSHTNTPIPCSFTSTFDIHININPHPHFTSPNGFTVSPPGAGEGNAWVVTPNPGGFLPGLAMDAIAAFGSPYAGGGFFPSFPCH